METVTAKWPEVSLSTFVPPHERVYYLLLELLLLVFKGLLNLVHETALLKKASRRTDAVQLQGRRQLDFLVFNHFSSDQLQLQQDFCLCFLLISKTIKLQKGDAGDLNASKEGS